MPDHSSPEPLHAHAWVEPAGAVGPEEPGDPRDPGEPAEDSEGATHDEFARRVEERVRIARYPHSLKRVVHSPRELAEGREIEQQAAVWVPVVTFAVTAVCAVVVVLLATTVAGDPGHGRLAQAVVALATIAFLAAGFTTLTRSQDYFEARRPGGRLVRTDLADAYETVRDAAGVLVELGVPPAALARVADLLPQAERLVDLLVGHEARGGVVRGHPAYDQLTLMGAEVTVLTDMAEERLGRRSSRRRDRPVEGERPPQSVEETALTPFDTLGDLVAMLGPDLPERGPARPSGR